jgi:hypothetical protein
MKNLKAEKMSVKTQYSYVYMQSVCQLLRTEQNLYFPINAMAYLVALGILIKSSHRRSYNIWRILEMLWGLRKKRGYQCDEQGVPIEDHGFDARRGNNSSDKP